MEDVRCIDCKNCFYPQEKKCRPQPTDCEKEYLLTEDDLFTAAGCLFFIPKEECED